MRWTDEFWGLVRMNVELKCTINQNTETFVFSSFVLSDSRQISVFGRLSSSAFVSWRHTRDHLWSFDAPPPAQQHLYKRFLSYSISVPDWTCLPVDESSLAHSMLAYGYHECQHGWCGQCGWPMANMPAGLQPPCVVNVAGLGATCRLVYSQRVWSMWLA